MDFGMDQVGLAGTKARRRADPGQTPASGALLGAGRCAALRLGRAEALHGLAHLGPIRLMFALLGFKRL